MGVPEGMAGGNCSKLLTDAPIEVITGGRVESAICVGSLAVVLARPSTAPPPQDTVAVLPTVEGAVLATFTVRVSGGRPAPGSTSAPTVHGPAGCVQLQPLPLIFVASRPAGTVSETVIVEDPV